jgi:hypothetical protein
MGFFESILAKIGASLAEFVWNKIEAKLTVYFEQRSQISAISGEAGALKEELKNATSDAERIQILRKIGSFSERLGS